jgi:hypothetical protein
MFAALLPLITTVVGSLVDRIPDPEARAKAERDALAAITTGLLDADKAQIDVNKVEAGHRSIFVAGWRPAIGWACALGVTYTVLRPIFIWMGADPAMPSLDSVLWELTFGLLGMGALRSHDKMKGLTK